MTDIVWTDNIAPPTDMVVEGLGHLKRDGEHWVADDGRRFVFTRDEDGGLCIVEQSQRSEG